MPDINSQIAAGVQPTVPLGNPLDYATKAINLRDMMQQQQLRQQQVQQSVAATANANAEAQQRATDLSDQQTVQGVMADPESSARLHSGDFSDIEGKVQPKTLDAVRAAQNTALTNKGAQTLQQNQIESAALGKINTTIEGLQSLKNDDGTPDLQAINRSLPGAIQHLRDVNAFEEAKIAPPANVNVTDPKQLTQWAASFGGAKALTDTAIEQQKAKAEADQAALLPAKTQAETANLKAETAGKQAQSDISSFEANALKQMQSDPNALASHVASVVDPSKYPQLYKETLSSAQAQLGLGNLAGAKKVLEDAGNTVTGRSPETISAKAAQAGADAAATAGIDVKKAVDIQSALAKNSPDAFAAISNPAVRQQATTQYIKDSNDYIDKLGTANQLQTTINQALAGNKAAPTVATLQELRTIVNRVNRTELDQATQAGSSYDRVKGWLDGKVEGQPIPANILGDMKTLSQASQQTAKQTYHMKVDMLNQTTGAKATYYEPAASMESQTHNGDTYQRKSGSNDPWVRVKTQ